MQTPPGSIQAGDLPVVPPLTLRHLQGRFVEYVHRHRAGSSVALTYQIHYTPSWTTQRFDQALKEISNLVQPEGTQPLLVMPYLSEEKLNILLEQGFSGQDLSGNLILQHPSGVLIYRTGHKNLFVQNQDLRNPFKGKSNTISRALLEQPEFTTGLELVEYLQHRGQDVSGSQVSRVLKALEAELYVSRNSDQSIVLKRPKALLDQLVLAWQALAAKPPLWKARVPGTPQQWLPDVFRALDPAQPMVLSGLSSLQLAGNTLASGPITLYCETVPPMLEGLNVQHNSRFANLEILPPPDLAVFYSAEKDAAGIRHASVLQQYLEVQASGDTRLLEGVPDLLQSIFRPILPRLLQLNAHLDLPPDLMKMLISNPDPGDSND